MSRAARVMCLGGLFVAVLCCSVPVAADASYDTRPRHAILFTDGTRFVAQDAWNSVAVYRTADGEVVHRFPAPARVRCIALSPDEKCLLVGCADGGNLRLWDAQTGECLWDYQPPNDGLRDIWDVSFAGNGERVVACGQEAIVLDVRTGGRIGGKFFPPNPTGIMSVALGPDGTSGFLIDWNRKLSSFDVLTSSQTATELAGDAPVRYSTDGKHVAFRSSGLEPVEHLSVVRVGELTKQDLGTFAHVMHIRPARDGSFLVTARTKRYNEEGRPEFVGTQIWTEDGRVKELWRFAREQGVNERTDYLPELMIGVSTDAYLVTTVTDLRTGKVLRTIDNSANARLEPMGPFCGTVPHDGSWSWGSAAIVAAVVALGLVAVFLIWRVTGWLGR